MRLDLNVFFLCQHLPCFKTNSLFSRSLPVSQLSGGCELTVVLQDFTAGCSSELSLQTGQTVELLERPSDRPGWCLVRTTDRSPPQEGLVPSSALCISHSRSSVEMECFFPTGKGKDINHLLLGEKKGRKVLQGYISRSL